MQSLKPCPFCGKKAEIILNTEFPGHYSVGCVNPFCVVQPCASYGDGGFVEEIPELVDAWNRRTNDEQIQP